MSQDNNLYEASRQWASRPDDQRFLTLDDLAESVHARRQRSWTAAPRLTELQAAPLKDDEIGLDVFDPTHGSRRVLTPTNWSFNQLAQFAGAPAAYLRKLPSQLAAINLQYGLEHVSQKDDTLVLAESNGHNVLRAMTSTTYGRIWDHEVVDAVRTANENSGGRWVIPSASYTTNNPKRATTLYASDRDVFIFLVDPKNAIEVDGEQLFRGFYTWNSEVGACTWGLCTFLYRYVCDNRIIWGATDVKELRVRHTSGAPARFAYEGAKFLTRYANESTTAITEGIQAARNKELKSELKKDQTFEDWLTARGFTRPQARGSMEAVEMEGGGRSLWDIVNGVTAYARTVPYTNDRVDMEARAGRLMALVA